MVSYSQDFPFGIMDVVELLHLRIRRRQADSIYTDCPLCGDRRGKMNVNIVRNIWRCNYCDEHGGMLALYARVNHISSSDAYREICDALKIGDCFWDKGAERKEPADSCILPGAGSTEAGLFQTDRQKPEGIQQASRASAQQIHQTFFMLFDMLSLRPAHREHLRSAKRGLTDEQIEECRFKSTPPHFLCRFLTEKLMKQGCTVQGVPGFYMDEKGNWTVKFNDRTSGILIPAVGADGLIHGAQILLDVPMKDKDDPPEKPGTKYIWLSSSSKHMGITSGSPVHFVGNPFARTIYVTEGLLKADIAHYLMNRSFVAVAGANNVAQLEPLFALLAQNGTELIVEAYDMDKYSNEMIAKGSTKIYKAARRNGMDCRRLTWNPNYKGVDDWQLALRRMGQQKKETVKQEMGLLCRKQRFRVYQLEMSGLKTIPFAFKEIRAMRQAGYEQPPASEYRLVLDTEFSCPENVEEKELLRLLKEQYGSLVPQDYRGRPLAPSDVVELYGQDGRSYFYVNTESFEPVRFSPFLAKPLQQNT